VKFFCIFATVKNKSTIKHQILAAGLLAVFLLITAARLFHTHGSTSRLADSSYSAHVHNNTDCPVCDYHFAKDTDQPAPAVMQAKQWAVVTPVASYTSKATSSIGLSYSDRGPPAVI
jgi:hypothetical protein